MKDIITPEYVITGVELEYSDGPDVASDTVVRTAVATGIHRASVECKECSHQWVVTESPEEGQLQRDIDGYFLACPCCDNEGRVCFPYL